MGMVAADRTRRSSVVANGFDSRDGYRTANLPILRRPDAFHGRPYR